jgi:two-component system sensor histidine kinase PhoQ
MNIQPGSRRHSRIPDSLRLRILLALALAFLGLLTTAILALDWNLRRSLERAQGDVLQAQLLGLVAAAEYEPDMRRLWVSENTDRRLLIPGSELVAEIRPLDDGPIWRSGSSMGIDILPPSEIPTGEIPRGQILNWTQPVLLDRRFAFRSVHIDWEHAGQTVGAYLFIVGQDLAPWQEQRRAFRWGLVSTFALIVVLALVLFGMFLRRALRPLVRIEDEIREIENGQRHRLTTKWPMEIRGLAQNLNALLELENDRQQRYQQALANLAHSLKTPLAAARHRLRQLPEAAIGEAVGSQGIDSELVRMDRIISWHLRRVAAPASGPGKDTERRTAVVDVCNDLVMTLQKVHADKTLRCDVALDDNLKFFGDPDDLYEILGNLLDNAFKYSRSSVRIEPPSRKLPGQTGLCVVDDGPGLEPEQATLALQRARRLDERQPGQGIGLATAHEIALAYGGDLQITGADRGGLIATLWLPREMLS